MTLEYWDDLIDRTWFKPYLHCVDLVDGNLVIYERPLHAREMLAEAIDRRLTRAQIQDPVMNTDFVEYVVPRYAPPGLPQRIGDRALRPFSCVDAAKKYPSIIIEVGLSQGLATKGRRLAQLCLPPSGTWGCGTHPFRPTCDCCKNRSVRSQLCWRSPCHPSDHPTVGEIRSPSALKSAPSHCCQHAESPSWWCSERQSGSLHCLRRVWRLCDRCKPKFSAWLPSSGSSHSSLRTVCPHAKLPNRLPSRSLSCSSPSPSIPAWISLRWRSVTRHLELCEQ